MRYPLDCPECVSVLMLRTLKICPWSEIFNPGISVPIRCPCWSSLVICRISSPIWKYLFFFMYYLMSFSNLAVGITVYIYSPPSLHHCSMSEKSWSRDFSGILPSLIFRISWHDWVMESVIVQGRDAVTDCICLFSFFVCGLVCGLFFIRTLPCWLQV